MLGTTVELRNVAGPRHMALTLDHGTYCERGGACKCSTESYTKAHRDPATGALGNLAGIRPVTASVTLPRGVWVGGFHPVVLRIAGVRSAIAQGLIECREVPIAEVESPTPPMSGSRGDSPTRRARRTEPAASGD